MQLEPGSVAAIHTVRGHIKVYTAEAPLFGKFVGRVWCEPHLRGSKAQGIVTKDYSIEVPPPDPA